MLVSLLIPQTEKRVEFSRSWVVATPVVSGCYVLTTFLGEILYIGQSINLARRMEEHLDDPVKTGATPFGKAFWFYYELLESHRLDSLERGWMNAHIRTEGCLPFFNGVNPPA